MTAKRIIYIIIPIFSLFISSCNSDIFVENEDLPKSTDVTIDGDGGQWSTNYSRKGLIKISLDYRWASSNLLGDLTYCGKNGKVLDADCSPSELESIDYENRLIYFRIGFIGDMIYVTSYYNAGDEITVALCLEYDYGVIKYINITIKEGTKLELISWYSTGDFILEENVESTTHSISLTNNGPISQKLEVLPYLDARCTDKVYPKDYSKDYWVDGLEYTLPLLSYDGYNWIWHDYDNIRIGAQRVFSPSAYSTTDKIVVDVPPYTKAKITYTLHYSRATEDGILTFYNSVEDCQFDVDMTWTSKYATSYDYEVEYEQ